MHKLGFVIAACVGLVACQTTTDGMSDAPATAATQFFGKALVADNGTVFIFNEDGSVDGIFADAEIDGIYTASATEICSSYTAPAQLAGREFCSTPAIDGDMVVFQRRDGSESQPYQIQG